MGFDENPLNFVNPLHFVNEFNFGQLNVLFTKIKSTHNEHQTIDLLKIQS